MSTNWKRASLGASVSALIVFSVFEQRAAGQSPSATAARAAAAARASSANSNFPPYQKVTDGFQEVVSTVDGKSLYTIWIRKKDNQMLAQLPRTYATDRHFIAMTVASGEQYAGLQAGERYVYWKRFDKRLALIEPNVRVRSTGDTESKDSVDRLFTDRVLLDVPILALGPGKAPIIDMDNLLLSNARTFFGSTVSGINPRLSTIKTAKAFPLNVELGFEVPVSGGRLKTLHYSISKIPKSTGYKPRVADERVGYFTTSYTDLGKYDDEETTTRYINRWHLEKADPKLKLSPPKTPIVFYIEHTTPKRYRYWVKRGILYWNKAFEKIGIRDAIVVEYQDKSAPKHTNNMDKHPEDVRYNFVRWLNNNVGTAIGPSRVHPLTGQILDADIILTDGWIRHYEQQFSELLPKIAMEGFSGETLSWLNRNPQWDPRIRMASPSEQRRLLAERARQQTKPFGGHPAANADSSLIGDDEYDGLTGRVSQINGMCLCAECKGFELQLLRMSLDMLRAAEDDEDKDEKEEEEKKEEEEEEDKQQDDSESDDDKNKEGDKDSDEEAKDEDKDAESKKEEQESKSAVAEKKKDEQILDGVPEKFIGPLLAELVAHEVGHTLGLRHNFKSSSIYSLAKINSDEVKGKPFAGSVMDYLPINLQFANAKSKGDHSMIDIGPYDMWAIEYGYTFEKDLKPILARVAEPELQYGTDEDTWGPDPRARRYDFSSNPLDYAKHQIELAEYHRARILDKFVEDGESWSKARKGYELTLGLQMRALSMMANWVGGVYVHRDKKGDENARKPFEVVSAEKQRKALEFCIQHSFRDKAFGLTPKLLQHLTRDQWWDDASLFSSNVDWPVHDRILSMQSSVLTMLLNPDTLRLVYDNEFRTEEENAFTLPELLETIHLAIWTELDGKPTEKASARKPWITSLRRNLQREHLERLIDLTMPGAGTASAYKPISNLALMHLRDVKKKIDTALEQQGMLDPYSRSHLTEAHVRIEKALDAQYIYNANELGGGATRIILSLGDEEKE